MAIMHWWLDELRGMLPPQLLTRLRKLCAHQALVITPNGIGDLSPLERDNAFCLQIPPSMVLRRRLTLPQAPIGTLSQIAGNEVGRASPLRLDRLYYDIKLIRRNPRQNTVDLDIRMVHRAPIEAALATCLENGLHPSRLELDDGPFRPKELRHIRRKRIRPVALPGLVLLVLSLASLAGLFWRGEAELDVLSAQMSEMRGKAHEVSQLENELQRRQAMAIFLPKRRHEPLMSAVMAELSLRLPDDSWLFQLELHDHLLRLRGFSVNASGLIAALDASPLLKDAQFRAPLIPGPQAGQERFDIAVTIRAGDRP